MSWHHQVYYCANLTRCMYHTFYQCNQRTASSGDFYSRQLSNSPVGKVLKTYQPLTGLPLEIDQFARYGCVSRSKEDSGVLKHSLISIRNFSNSNYGHKLSLKERLKVMYKDYCFILLPVHFLTSAAWFGGFYYMASTGFDIVSFLELLNINEKFISPFRGETAKTMLIHDLAITCALFNISAPLRYFVSLGLTSVSVKYLKKWGYLDQGLGTEQLKQYIKEKTEALKRK